MITESGIYDLPDAEYHSDPVPGGSLSNTEARRILKAPAIYRYFKGVQEHKTEFEFGHAAHLAVLDIGAKVVVLDFDDMAITIGRDRNRRAIARWIECTDRDVWPGYSDDVEMVSLPRWAEMAYEQEMETA